jgi:hypothetical protein
MSASRIFSSLIFHVLIRIPRTRVSASRIEPVQKRVASDRESQNGQPYCVLMPFWNLGVFLAAATNRSSFQASPRESSSDLRTYPKV